MEPKEKAQELYDKYRNIAASFGSIEEWHKNTKQCALIAIDEILQTNSTIKRTSEDLLTQIVQTKAYWYRVQEEINLL